MKIQFRLKGGPGSGHHGHSGRPGDQGGSLPGKGTGSKFIVTRDQARDLLQFVGHDDPSQHSDFATYRSGGYTGGKLTESAARKLSAILNIARLPEDIVNGVNNILSKSDTFKGFSKDEFEALISRIATFYLDETDYD